MASKTRRAAALVRAEKDRSQEKEELKEVKVENDEDDDAPPPILEREESCGENDDTDGDVKEGDNSSNEDKTTEEESFINQGNLMEALAGVFAVDNDSPSLKKRRTHEPQESLTKAVGARGITQSLLLNSKNVRSVLSSSKTSSKSPIPTHRPNTAVAGPSTSGTRKYGVPPPIPASLRAAAANTVANGVGSNTSLGPAKLLENRKRLFDKDGSSIGKRTGSLVAYNGGRAGEKFTKKSATPGSSSSSGASTSSSTTAFDVHSMLRDQSPVRMQVSVGADREQLNGDSLQDSLELAALQKESIANIAKKCTNHSLLLGSMVLNGLNVLQTKNTAEYKKFAGELFALVSKYDIT